MVSNIKENRVKRPASSINSSTLARKSQGSKFTANSRRGYNNIGIDRNINHTKKPSKLKKHISEEQARKNVKSLTIDLYSEKGHTRKKSKLKEPTKIRDSKESSLKNYTKKYPEKAPVTKLAQPKKSYPSMYKMHDVVQSYKTKVAKTRNSNLSRMVNDTMEDFENESFPSERPNQEVPVPHKMNPLNSKRFSTDFDAKEESKISKNETNTTSKAQTDDSFGVPKTQKKTQVRESISTLNSGEVLELTLNNRNSIEEKLQEEHFSTESPVPNKKPSFYFDKEELRKPMMHEAPSTLKKTSFDDLFHDEEKAEADQSDDNRIKSTMKQISSDSDDGIEDLKIQRSNSSKLIPQPDMVNPKIITSPTKQKAIFEKKTTIIEQTQKLINTVIETQKKYEREKTERKNTLGSFCTSQEDRSISRNSPSLLNQNVDTPVKGCSDKSEEDLRMEVSLPTAEKLEPGSQKHLLSFHKQQAEDEAVEDHKPSQDLLSEERHKQGYEDKFEKEHVMKVFSFEKAESLSHTFLNHVSEHTRARSNSHNLLTIPSFLQQNSEEKRSLTPNKVEQTKEIGKNSTEKQSKSSESNNIIEDEDMAQKPAIPIPIEQFTPVKEAKPVKKICPAKQFVEAEDPECIVINNEIRNIRKEKELEMPHRPSSILKYRKMNTLESKHESEEKKSEETKEEISASNPLYDNSCLRSPLDSDPPLETFTDDNGLDLLIDPDEDPEVAAQIDAALAEPTDPELVKPAPPYLPALPANKEYTLVLDLDETLIHYRDDDKFYLVRPGVPQFLAELSQLFDIVLFTAGVKKYADCIVDNIDPQRYIAHRLYRRHTVFRDAMYIKDLSLLGRDLAKTLIIDNLYESFLSQPHNGILVKSWYDDMEDTELLTLLPFLKGLVEDEVPDIREVLKQIMNSSSDPGDEDEEYLESGNPDLIAA